MNIAITAASGHLGHAIVQACKEDFDLSNIRGIARTTEKAADLDIEIYKGDYSYADHFIDALKNVDVVLLISSMAEPQERIQQHRNVIEAARINQVKKIVYSSIYGEPGKSGYFDRIIQSNRQTEKDIKDSGLNYIIGRNGLYIDPDIEAIESYKSEGIIKNSAADGKCAYTSRKELARAYVSMIKDSSLDKNIYNLCGESITQNDLAHALNAFYGLDLKYEPISDAAFLNDRVDAHGEYLGKIIGGIYEGIRNGVFDIHSDFRRILDRPHKTVKQMLADYENTK